MTSILSRKRDLAYLAFFLIHVPVMLCLDLAPFYPESLKPQFITDIHTFYVGTYGDQFFSSPPAWFTFYTWMELLYHIPLSVWAIGALLRGSSSTCESEAGTTNGDAGNPKLPIHLLIFAVQTAVTTSTCIADYLSWSGFSSEQKLELGKLYVPYLALSVFMGVDMYSRLNASLSKRTPAGQNKVE
ncbi:hypothetical protein LTR08_007232 [Meristemomyces frigidus]|nr:hypothetical protein LTR08_007232 [Meristemomyces frigidus]